MVKVKTKTHSVLQIIRGYVMPVLLDYYFHSYNYIIVDPVCPKTGITYPLVITFKMIAPSILGFVKHKQNKNLYIPDS